MKKRLFLLLFVLSLGIVRTTTADNCYFDEYGNTVCVDADPWNDCSDGHCE